MTQGEFKKVSEAEVRSTSGFTVKISKGMLRYIQDDGRYVSLDADYVVAEKLLHVYISTSDSWMFKGTAGQALLPDDVSLLAARIGEAVRVLNINSRIGME